MHVGNRRGIVVSSEANQERVDDAESELEHLELSEVDLKGVFETEGREEVVAVHESVNKRVDPGAEVGSSVTNTVVQQTAPNNTDGGVVVDVQEGELLVFFAEDDEDGVEHVEEFGQVVSEDPELDRGVEFSIQVEDVGNLQEEGEKSDDHKG